MDFQPETGKGLSAELGLAAFRAAARLLCAFLATSPAQADAFFAPPGADSHPYTMIPVTSVIDVQGIQGLDSQLSPPPVKRDARLAIQAGAQVSSLTLVSGTSAEVSNPLTANRGASLASADTFVKASCTDQCTGGHMVDGRRGTVAPSTLLLVGSALAGLGAVTRRLFKAGKRADGRVPLRI